MMKDAIYTLSEAAEHLRLTNRGVAKIARQHGLCMVRGRDFLFTDADIEGIKKVLRIEPKGFFETRSTIPSDFERVRKLLREREKKRRT